MPWNYETYAAWWRANGFEWKLFGFMGFLLLGALIMFALAINRENAETARLVSQCMDDGKPEYECRAMFKRNRGGAIPIVVPMYGG